MKEEDAPNPSTKNFLNKPVNDAESLRSRQPTHVQEVSRDGGLPRTQIRGPAQRAFSKTPLLPEIVSIHREDKETHRRDKAEGAEREKVLCVTDTTDVLVLYTCMPISFPTEATR